MLGLALLLVPRIALVTMGPGDHPYERFGHAAIAVTERGRDTVYNYGAADFADPDFFVDFVRGRARFRVATGPLAATIRSYAAKDRDVWRQELRLPPDGAARLVARLERDADPAHGAYVYDHFADNCTTRVRDRIDEASGGALRGGTAGRPLRETYRDQVRRGLAGRPDLALGAELLGRPLDARPDLWRALYLPDLLRAEVARLGIGGAPRRLHARRAPSPWSRDPHAARHLLWLAGLAGALALGALARRGGAATRLAFGAAGAVLLALSLALDGAALLLAAPEIRDNELLLVLVPTDAALFLPPRLARPYARARLGGLLLVVALHLAGALRQDSAAAVALAVGLVAPLALVLPPAREHSS